MSTLIIVIVFAVLLLSVYLLSLTMGAPPDPPLVSGYFVSIDHSKWESGVFRIRELAAINPELAEYYNVPLWVDLPEREVTSTNVGLFTREVKIMPIRADSSGNVIITLSDGRILKGKICYFQCEIVRAELNDIPVDSFLAAKDGEDMVRLPYIDTETIYWSVNYPRQGITFAFVPPPFHYLRPIIEPLLGASSINQWILLTFAKRNEQVTMPIQHGQRRPA